MANEAVFAKKGEGTAYWVVGTLMELKATHDQTNGKFTVAEFTIAPGAPGAPLHRHSSAEALYVLEGQLEFQIGDRKMELGPGSFVHVPSGAWEFYRNIGKTPARILTVWTDPNLHKFFAEAFERAPKRELPPPGAPPTPEEFERLAAAARPYGLELKPPPM